MLLGQDQTTGEVEWHEAARIKNLTLQVCVTELVDLVNLFQESHIEHDVYCEEMPSETSDNKKDDK